MPPPASICARAGLKGWPSAPTIVTLEDMANEKKAQRRTRARNQPQLRLQGFNQHHQLRQIRARVTHGLRAVALRNTDRFIFGTGGKQQIRLLRIRKRTLQLCARHTRQHACCSVQIQCPQSCAANKCASDFLGGATAAPSTSGIGAIGSNTSGARSISSARLFNFKPRCSRPHSAAYAYTRQSSASFARPGRSSHTLNRRPPATLSAERSASSCEK